MVSDCSRIYRFIFKARLVITKYNKIKVIKLILFQDNEKRKSKNAQSFKRTNYMVSIKSSFQKQPSKNVLRKRCSENLQQIYESIQLKNGAV